MQGDLSSGTLLGAYRVDRPIGRGGMGVVYSARHTTLNRAVALKVLAPELASDKEFRERFIRECELAAAIDHPNVIPVYDGGEVEGVLYIAMRLVKGTDLGATLQRDGALDPDRAAAQNETGHLSYVTWWGPSAR